MKSSPQVEAIGQDCLFLVAKATELFVHYLSQEAHQKSNIDNNLEYKHLADKKYKPSHGQSPLHLAAAYGHHDVAKLLLNYGADPNASEDEGNTHLIYGAQGDHPHVCYELLTRGADIAMTNANGLNAYKAAILKNASTIIILLNYYTLMIKIIYT